MISSFVSGVCASCGDTHVTSTLVSGTVVQPAMSAAAPSTTADKLERTALRMTNSFKRGRPLQDAILHHRVENDVDVLRQSRIEVVVRRTVNYAGPGRNAVLGVEQASLGNRPGITGDRLCGHVDRLPYARVVAVEAGAIADAQRRGRYGSRRALNPDDARHQHGLGIGAADRLAQLRLLDATALGDQRIGGDSLHAALREQRHYAVFERATHDIVGRHRYYHDALEWL